MDKQRTVDDIIRDHKEINALATALHGESDGYVRVSGVTPMERLMVVAVLKELTKRYALVDPAALAKLESDAARVTELEQQLDVLAQTVNNYVPDYYTLKEQVETLKAVVMETREALRKAVAVIQSWHDLDRRNMPKEEQERMWQVYRDNAPEMKPILAALSLTPASVAKEVEDARVGRAVREWLDAQGWVDRVVFADTGGLHVMLNELREVITKAREESR